MKRGGTTTDRGGGTMKSGGGTRLYLTHIEVEKKAEGADQTWVGFRRRGRRMLAYTDERSVAVIVAHVGTKRAPVD